MWWSRFPTAQEHTFLHGDAGPKPTGAACLDGHSPRIASHLPNALIYRHSCTERGGIRGKGLLVIPMLYKSGETLTLAPLIRTVLELLQSLVCSFDIPSEVAQGPRQRGVLSVST